MQEVTGIILESRPFEDLHQIITLFTFEQGLVKLFITDAHRRGVPLQPFYKIEALIKKGKKELDYLHSAKFLKALLQINTHLPRRGLLEIEVARHLASCVLSSCFPAEPLPKLYVLFELYLSALGLVKNPYNLFKSFQLKYLISEGLLLLEPSCHERELCTLALSKSLNEIDEVVLTQELSDKINRIYNAKGGT